MSENRKTNFIRQGTILAMASIIVRMIGIVYRIPVANTIGSKCQDINITRLVVELKSEIEKIREQIQNIE